MESEVQKGKEMLNSGVVLKFQIKFCFIKVLHRGFNVMNYFWQKLTIGSAIIYFSSTIVFLKFETNRTCASIKCLIVGFSVVMCISFLKRLNI